MLVSESDFSDGSHKIQETYIFRIKIWDQDGPRKVDRDNMGNGGENIQEYGQIVALENKKRDSVKMNLETI